MFSHLKLNILKMSFPSREYNNNNDNHPPIPQYSLHFFFSLSVICAFSVVFQPVGVICLAWWHAALSKNKEKTPFRHHQLERQLD